MESSSSIYKATMDPIEEESELKLPNVIKATELFQLCDKESKGFVTALDLKQICDEVGLNEQQIDDVFQQLDKDKNGFITAEEFENGFEKFAEEVAISTTKVAEEEEDCSWLNDEPDLTMKRVNLSKCHEQSTWADSVDVFQLPKNTDLAGLLQDNLALQLWSQIQSQYTEILPVFEEFLQNLANEHRRIREETAVLHNSFNRKSQAYEQQIRVLYEEMEGQIQSERERLLNKKVELESQLRHDLDALSEEKDKDVQELLEKLLQATTQLELASEDKVTTENENQQLLAEQEFLKTQLDDYQHEVDELRAQLEKAKSDSANDKNKRFRSALQLSEKIAWEKETLGKQLNLLRSINRRLQDEKDEIANSVMKETESIENIFLLTSGDVYNPRLSRNARGSVLSDYFPETMFSNVEDKFESSHPCVSPAPPPSPTPSPGPSLALTNPFLVDCIENQFSNECADDTANKTVEGNLFLKMMNDIEIGEDPLSTYRNYTDPDLDALHSFHEDGRQILPSVTHDDSKAPTLCLVHPNNHQQNGFSVTSLATTIEPAKLEDDEIFKMPLSDIKPTDEIQNNHNNNNNNNNNQNSTSTLERLQSFISTPTLDANKIMAANKNASVQQSVFKVIFIGDSGVGKTSLINRICGGYFSDRFCTTIGVDFRVKTVLVDGHQVVLQLWDTAGQERFRSITSQYMRRSDGVLIVYDVNSEMSFRNVNSWLSTMESVNSDNVIAALVGNKLDLCSQFGTKVVATSDGMLAAADIDALFFETSAKDYFGVEDMIFTMARKLRKKQLEDLENCARLSTGTDILKVPPKKSTCC